MASIFKQSYTTKDGNGKRIRKNPNAGILTTKLLTEHESGSKALRTNRQPLNRQQNWKKRLSLRRLV
jgi:hypothetical protein